VLLAACAGAVVLHAVNLNMLEDMVMATESQKAWQVQVSEERINFYTQILT
jgi:hypothetical protein